jgi:hypothetical protein
MITFSNLGKHGRLGNAMFQYAALKSLSNHLNCEVFVPEDLDNRSHHNQICLLNCFKINCKRGSQIAQTTFRENNKGGYYDPNFWNCKVDTELFGHYESELYFNFDTSEFDLKENFQRFAQTTLNNIRQNNLVVGIHIRRGDKADQINEKQNEYLQKATEHFKNCIFMIFSGGSHTNDNAEDIAWCKENLKINGTCYYSKNDTIHDFSLMVNCDHLILNSTSTIGWWAGYLNKNPNKKIIVPKQGVYVTGEYIKGETFYSKQFIQI